MYTRSTSGWEEVRIEEGRECRQESYKVFFILFVTTPPSNLYMRAVAAVGYKIVSGMVVVVYLHVLIYDTMSQ